ncbi:hypothetical protein C0585_05800 [Candidatus Woesearchaeota archaeon]|nr:MAG: hypothetical protein C0585_05800 [Candidatus Woesearchaeota archaeon]
MRSALCLISSGIDSPVAASVMMDKLNISFIFFDNQFSKPNNIQRKKVIDIIQKLSDKHDKKFKLFIIDHETPQLEYKANCINRFQCIFCKRMMYNVSEIIAKEKNIGFLLTGENIGQVASQTLENMITLDKATDKVILRPLIAHDKNDIIKIARQIDTFDISIRKDIDCPFLPKNPATRSKEEILVNQESKINTEKLATDAAKSLIEINVTPK